MATLWAFLGVVVCLQFGYPVTFYGELWMGIYMVAYIGMILFGIRLVRLESWRLTPFVFLGVLLAAAGVWFSFNQQDVTAQAVMLTSVGLFQLVLLVALFRFLVSSPDGTSPGELLLVAIVAYLLLGGVFGVAFNLLETAVPGSFIDGGAPDRHLVWQGLLYYSYVTIATLGYGEVLAVTPWARSLATLEAVSGTLYLAVVIARLVGAFAASDGRFRLIPKQPPALGG